MDLYPLLDDSSFEYTHQFDPISFALPFDSTELISPEEILLMNDGAWNPDHTQFLSANDCTFDESIDIDYFSSSGNSLWLESNLSAITYGENVACTDKVREVGKCKLDLEEIRKYFHMPVMKAAKEMNVGLTTLKKRCRDLGIPRWPYRKIKSLNNIIQNVQELDKGTHYECVKLELQMLKEHRRIMEENPLVELTEGNKKLRQACFKANYKRKRARELSYSPYSH